MNPYEAIYVRKSVREFQKKQLTEEDRKQIVEYMDTLVPLVEDVHWQIQIAEEEKEFFGLWKVKAPAYLVFSCETTDQAAYCNAGYILEQLLLYLHTRDIGSCYQGGLKWKKMPGDGMHVLMIVAIGYSDDISRRQQDFKRRHLNKLVQGREDYSTDVLQILEAGRLAPSAMNMQPWSFVVYHNRIHVFLETGLLKKETKYSKMLDMGILMCHMALAAEELWIDARFSRLESLTEKKVRKYEYVATMLIQ